MKHQQQSVRLARDQTRMEQSVDKHDDDIGSREELGLPFISRWWVFICSYVDPLTSLFLGYLQGLPYKGIKILLHLAMLLI